MDTIELKNADQMMTSASLMPDGIQVRFADGCYGTIPFEALKDVKGPESIIGLELPNPFELFLVGIEGRYPEIPWDFARHYCDASYRERIESQAWLGRQTLGSRIRQVRKASGLTQQALARAAGIGRVTLVRLEKGEQRAKFKTLSAIAQAVGMPTIDLFLEPDSYEEAQGVFDRLGAEPITPLLQQIELEAWSLNAERHRQEFSALDKGLDAIFGALRKVAIGFDAVGSNREAEEVLDLVEEGMNLASRIFKVLRCAKFLSELGYYEQALALQRIGLEHLIVLYDLPECKETRQALKNQQSIRISKEMLERFQERNPSFPFKEAWKNNYRILSKIIHASGTGMQQLPPPEGQVGYHLVFASYYDSGRQKQNLRMLRDHLLLLLRVMEGMANLVNVELDIEESHRLLLTSRP
ncbi:MAG: helix-turn-helix transcriptional regulator [Chloroflexi bacterium]|nr:helix-turn-helix transcriptional regulator [Chloroflexota bacterium]